MYKTLFLCVILLIILSNIKGAKVTYTFLEFPYKETPKNVSCSLILHNIC